MLEYISIEYQNKLEVLFCWFRTAGMINRDSRGHLYSAVRGEILGFAEDKLLRKHLPRMFSLIRNKS